MVQMVSIGPFRLVSANLPTFDEDSRMRILQLPVTSRVGSVIYRLRASDPEFDYPLQFSISGGGNPDDLLTLEAIPCMRQHSICEANVVLNRQLQVYF